MKAKVDFYGISFEGDDGGVEFDFREILPIFEIMKPKPSPVPLIRIGGDRDGSYLLPDDLDGITACFSPGVNNFKYFEDYIAEHYGIDCHMCDFSSDVEKFKTPIVEDKQTFRKKWLDVEGAADSITLESWVNDCAPSGDLLMQIDIEGAEYRNILAAPDSTLSRFRIVVIELHGLKRILEAGVFRNVIAPFFEKMDRHFVCVHAHPNNCNGAVTVPGTDIDIPAVLELTFIRKDRLGTTALQHPPMLPHPLDIAGNMIRRPPLFLGAAWSGGQRSIESRMEILERQFAYRESSRILEEQEDQTDNVFDLFARCLQGIDSRAPGSVKINPVAEARLREVANGCKFKLGNVPRGQSKRGIVGEAGDFFFQTDVGLNRYIQIDLEKRCNVRKIVIANRKDAHFDHARGLFCILSDRPDRRTGNVFAITSPASLLSGEALELEVLLPPTRARFVTICSAVNTALHFSAIRVYAGGGKQQAVTDEQASD